jgi:hypothetical protein
MNVFARLVRVLIVVVLASASPVAFAHDEDDGHEHAHGPVVRPRNFDHAVELVREGLERLGVAVSKGDMHAPHELSDGVVVPARAFGKLAAARPGAAPANIRAINTLGQDIAKLVDAMHVAADSSKADVVVAKWKEIEMLVPQLDAVAPRPTLVVTPASVPEAGKPATLSLAVRLGDGRQVTAFGGRPDVARVVVASRDHTYFFRTDVPKSDERGMISVTFSPPTEGEYVVFANACPMFPGDGKDGCTTVSSRIKVGGGPQAVIGERSVDRSTTRSIEGVRYDFDIRENARAGQTTGVGVTASAVDNADLPPIEMSGLRFSAVSHDCRHGVYEETLTILHGRTVSTGLTFPHSGTYTIWAQFEIAGKQVTLPFVVEVADAE